MKTLFDPVVAAELCRRIAALSPDSPRQWGKMDVAQMAAHCTACFEMALGERLPPRVLIGRLIGWIVKPLALGGDAQLRRNAPTLPELTFQDQRHLPDESQRLLHILHRFTAAGPAGCTTHPHSFFGRLTPQQWGVLMYKHTDHHLRQFGA